MGPGDPLPFFSTSMVGTTLVGVLGVVVVGACPTSAAVGLPPPPPFDLEEARTLSSLLMNVSMSSLVIPMAAAAVKYGASVLSQCEPQAGKKIKSMPKILERKKKILYL